MTLLMPNSDTIKLTMSPNSEMKVPSRGLFCKFPKFLVVSVIKDGLTYDTENWPSAAAFAIPRTGNTCRFINMNWKGIEVQAEYDNKTSIIKIIKTNADYITIEVK